MQQRLGPLWLPFICLPGLPLPRQSPPRRQARLSCFLRCGCLPIPMCWLCSPSEPNVLLLPDLHSKLQMLISWEGTTSLREGAIEPLLGTLH